MISDTHSTTSAISCSRILWSASPIIVCGRASSVHRGLSLQSTITCTMGRCATSVTTVTSGGILPSIRHKMLTHIFKSISASIGPIRLAMSASSRRKHHVWAYMYDRGMCFGATSMSQMAIGILLRTSMVDTNSPRWRITSLASNPSYNDTKLNRDRR